MTVFDRESARRLAEWYSTDAGRDTCRLQTALIMKLLKPRPGERLLDVGCGPGLQLLTFKREGLLVSGIDPSPDMLEMARQRLGCSADLYPGRAEDLPFEDNAFDIVTLITSLEFVDDPVAALSEAIRVAKKRVFIGALNSMSLTALGRRARGLISDNIYRQARFFSLWELTGMIKRQAGPAKITWASVGILPPALACRAAAFESRPIVQRLPIGSFLGVAVDVAYTLRTDNLLVDSLAFRRGRAPAAKPTGCGSFHRIPMARRPRGRHKEV